MKQDPSDIFETEVYKHLQKYISIFDRTFEYWEITATIDRIVTAIELELENIEMAAIVPCTRFDYGGDSSTLGSRWTTWVELFDLYVLANGMKDDAQIRATFLSMMGSECYQIYKVNCEDKDDLAAIKTTMNKVLVVKRSEYTEICAFRRAVKHKDESVNDYAMNLRLLAKHCNYGDQLDKEIERQFVVSCGMIEVEKECIRTDNLTLEKVLTMARGYERSANNLRGLRTPEYSSQINYNSPGKESFAKPKSWNRRTQSTGSAYGQSGYASSSGGSSGRCDRCGRCS